MELTSIITLLNYEHDIVEGINRLYRINKNIERDIKGMEKNHTWAKSEAQKAQLAQDISRYREITKQNELKIRTLVKQRGETLEELRKVLGIN